MKRQIMTNIKEVKEFVKQIKKQEEFFNNEIEKAISISSKLNHAS